VQQKLGCAMALADVLIKPSCMCRMTVQTEKPDAVARKEKDAIDRCGPLLIQIRASAKIPDSLTGWEIVKNTPCE
jgi:hypothetical protein